MQKHLVIDGRSMYFVIYTRWYIKYACKMRVSSCGIDRSFKRMIQWPMAIANATCSLATVISHAHYFSSPRFACGIAFRSHTRPLQNRDQKRPDYTGLHRHNFSHEWMRLRLRVRASTICNTSAISLFTLNIF